MISECMVTGEQTIRDFGEIPTRIVANCNSWKYLPELSSEQPRFLVWSRSYIASR
ncbi:MAG: hypothetical protein AABW89_04630 [Nanoarchaeota archaeon]